MNGKVRWNSEVDFRVLELKLFGIVNSKRAQKSIERMRQSLGEVAKFDLVENCNGDSQNEHQNEIESIVRSAGDIKQRVEVEDWPLNALERAVDAHWRLPNDALVQRNSCANGAILIISTREALSAASTVLTGSIGAQYTVKDASNC
jgi:hypothetical protein